MKLQKHNVLGLVIFSLYIFSKPLKSLALVEDVLDIIHVAKEVTTGVLKAWDIVGETGLGESIDLPMMREKQRKILKRLKEVTRKIDETNEMHAHQIAAAIDSVEYFTEKNAQIFPKIERIKTVINDISSRYQQMLEYKNYEDTLEEQTLITFAQWTVSPNSYSVPHLMDNLHLTLFAGKNKANTTINLLTLLAQYYEDFLSKHINNIDINERAILDICEAALRNDKSFSIPRILENVELIMVNQTMYYRAMVESSEQICRTQQSAQQFLYSLYSDISLAELKGYVMVKFSWMILRNYGKGNYTQESKLMREDYERREERSLKLLREVMRRADRTVWRCDPPQYIKGTNYDEVTRLLQGYIENEVDMNTEETCREDCSFYQSTKSEGCFKSKFCARQQRCTGKLYHCTFVDSDMWVCPSALNSTRRYDFIEYENGRKLGKQETFCTRGETKVDSWWRYLLWHCSYCFCLCDEQSHKSDRFFNLRESVSDIKNNKVITGLRFVKKNRIFHLQIQEGELLERGAINVSSLKWKPLEEYQIFDDEVRNGRDFHTLSYGNRSIDLDDIETDDNSFVVTGVRFRVIGAHLNLEARFTEFNFTTGELVSIERSTFWKSNDNTDVSGNKREKIELRNPDIPTRTLVKSMPDSRDNQYIDFVNTSMDKDAAQTTVPYIDVQNVVSNPPVPLAGVGIYHKGRDGFGGFLAPKVITYDFTRHVHIATKVMLQDTYY